MLQLVVLLMEYDIDADTLSFGSNSAYKSHLKTMHLLRQPENGISSESASSKVIYIPAAPQMLVLPCKIPQMLPHQSACPKFCSKGSAWSATSWTWTCRTNGGGCLELFVLEISQIPLHCLTVHPDYHWRQAHHLFMI